MTRIQKFDTFLKEIYTNHTNKSLIEGIIDAFSAIFEADKEYVAGRSGLGTHDSSTPYAGGYGGKIEQKSRQGMELEPSSKGTLNKRHGDYKDPITGRIIPGNQQGRFNKGGENTKVDELGDNELQAFEFNENSFAGMPKDLVDELKKLSFKQGTRPKAFTQKQLKDIGTCCYRIINSGNQGMVNSENATKRYIAKNKGVNIVIATHDDVTKVIEYLNAELAPLFSKSEEAKSDDELIDPIHEKVTPVIELLNVSADAAYKEVEKVSTALNDEQKNYRTGGLTDQEARAKGLDVNLVNEKNPYYTLKLKYSKKLKNNGATRVGSDTRDAIIQLIKEASKELGDTPDAKAVKEMLNTFYKLKSSIDSPIHHMMFKNAGKISKDVGASYRKIPNIPVNWEDLYEGSGKQQSLITNFRAFNAGAYAKIGEALKKYEELSKEGKQAKIPESIFKIPTKFIKLLVSLKNSGMPSADAQKWLREQAKYIVENSNVDPKAVTDLFNQKKAEVLANVKDDSILHDLADSITYDASSYAKLMAQGDESASA